MNYSTITNTDIQAKRGDTFGIQVTITDQDSVAVNITGMTVRFTLREVNTLTTEAVNTAIDDTESILTKTVTTHTTPLSGISTINFSATDTNTLDCKTYEYDIQLEDGVNRYTVQSGKFKLVADVSRS